MRVHPGLLLSAALILYGATVGAQTHQADAHGAHSPYADEARSPIASLSAREVGQLERGEGMGLSRAAELNRYPGPRHVLDAAAALGLTAEQQRATQRIFDEMNAEAVRLGGEILEKERALSRRFEHRHVDESAIRRLTSEIGALQAELRFVHLAAHLRTTALLSNEQIARYDDVRGYRNLGK